MKLRISSVLSLIVLANLFCGTVSARTDYFAVLLNDQKCGYAVQSRQVKGNIVETTEKMNITINRFNVSMTSETVEKCRETLDGEPLSFESVQNLSTMSTKIKGVVEPNGFVNVTTSSMGNTYSRKMRWPEGAVMMEGLRQIQLDKGLDPGTEYEVKIFSPQLIDAVNMQIEVGQKQKIDLAGRKQELHKVTSKMQIPAAGEIVTVAFVDENMRMYKSTIPLMDMRLELVKCPKEAATSDINPVEVAVQTFVPAPSPMKNLQQAKKGIYILESTDPNQTLLIQQTDFQKVSSTEEGKIRVAVEKKDIPRGAKLSADVNEDVKKYLKPGRYVQSDNPEIKKLSRKAIGDTEDAGLAAEKIESFVAGYITQADFSVGYATAAEVLETKTGDCSEFAILTTALCRAAGIPARIAVGIAYIDEFAGMENSFGGHSWTQVFIDGQWYNLDAAFRSAGLSGFDCGHILLAAGGGAPEDFLSLLNTVGKIKINSAELKF